MDTSRLTCGNTQLVTLAGVGLTCTRSERQEIHVFVWWVLAAGYQAVAALQQRPHRSHNHSRQKEGKDPTDTTTTAEPQNVHLIPFLTRIYRHFFAHSFCPPAMYLCPSFRRHCRLYIPQFGYARENEAFRRFGISVPLSISSSSQQSCQCHSCHQFHPSYIIHNSSLHQFISSLLAVYGFIISAIISIHVAVVSMSHYISHDFSVSATSIIIIRSITP